MLVMVQREVGERLAAGPGRKAYGAVSVKVAYHAIARVVGRVPASVFVPRPAVESVLVRIDRRPVVAMASSSRSAISATLWLVMISAAPVSRPPADADARSYSANVERMAPMGSGPIPTKRMSTSGPGPPAWRQIALRRRSRSRGTSELPCGVPIERTHGRGAMVLRRLD